MSFLESPLGHTFHRCMLFIVAIVILNGPQPSAAMPSSVRNHKKVKIGLTENTPVLEKCHSGLRYGGLGCEFKVNE